MRGEVSKSTFPPRFASRNAFFREKVKIIGGKVLSLRYQSKKMTMKKRLIILFVAVMACVGNIFAEFRYGPTIEMGMSTLSFKQDLFDVKSTYAATAGIATELMFPGIGFGINSGITYELRGAQLAMGQRTYWSSQGYGDARAYLHYLSIPINLRFKWHRMSGLEDYWMPYIYGGPVFDFVLGHSRMSTFQFAAGCLGLRAGFGCEIMRRWQVQGSYTWGVSYSLKDKILENFSARNRCWQIGVVYLF
jgi:hypothetical protein